MGRHCPATEQINTEVTSTADAGQGESKTFKSVCDGVFVVGATVDCACRRKVYSIGVAEEFGQGGMV